MGVAGGERDFCRWGWGREGGARSAGGMEQGRRLRGFDTWRARLGLWQVLRDKEMLRDRFWTHFPVAEFGSGGD